MKIHQLSLFLENKPGHLSAICRRLAEEKINIVTLSLADTEQFGILRLIIGEWERARDVLQKAGFVVKVTEVVAMEVDDRPGEYMYAFTFHRGDRAVLVVRFDNPDGAIETLKAGDVNILDSVELYA